MHMHSHLQAHSHLQRELEVGREENTTVNFFNVDSS